MSLMTMTLTSTTDINTFDLFNKSNSHEEWISGTKFNGSKVTSAGNKIVIYNLGNTGKTSTCSLRAYDYTDEFNKLLTEESWVSDFLQKASQLNDVKYLLPFYKEINRLISLKKFDTCNVFIKNVRVSELSDVLLVGILRLTFAWKNKLPAWPLLLNKAKNELNDRGYDSEVLLKGLS